MTNQKNLIILCALLNTILKVRRCYKVDFTRVKLLIVFTGNIAKLQNRKTWYKTKLPITGAHTLNYKKEK